MVLNFSGVDRSTMLGRAIRWPLTLIPSGIRLPIMQGTLRGFRWIVGSSNNGCWLGSYERNQQILFEKWVKEGDVIFDIGAHVGFYTLLGSVLVGGRGQVVAFEPVPKNLSYLKKHLQMNSVSNVEVVEAAVSDRHGHVCLSSGPSNSMWHIDAQGELEVQTVSLDDLVLNAKLPPPNVIKMDIEGAEFLALNGSARVVKEFHPVLLLSTHGIDVHQKCCRFLESAGYRLTPIGQTSLDKCRELFAVYGTA
jgi:FkbM family methyltransferase